MKGRRAALALAFVAAATALSARAQTVPRILVASASVPMTLIPGTATTAVAHCGSETPLVGGGMLAERINPALPLPPSPAMRGQSSYPSDVNGAPVVDATADPLSWSATANFGIETQAGNRITSLALCTTRTFDQRVVVHESVNAPIQAGTLGKVTVTCPTGTMVVGGGAQATPPGAPALKPVGMYPSDEAGNMLPDGAANATSRTAVAGTADPAAWSAIVSSGGQASPNTQAHVFALCVVESVPPPAPAEPAAA